MGQMKALVLGGSGFIGSHLVDALLAAGHKVRVFDRSPERFRPTPRGVEFMQGQLADSALLAEALARVDVVFHLVSTTTPGTANLDPVADVEGNLVGSLRLLELMRAAGVRRLLFLSSGGTVYGIPGQDPVPETHPLRPISSYGVVKVAIENYLRMERHLNGLSYGVIRAANPYGPRQGHGGVQGVIGTYLNNIAAGEPPELWGDGSVVRDFIYVKDLADLCLRLAESGAEGTFNAGSGEGHSIAEIIAALAAVTGVALKPRRKPARGIDVPRVVLDISKAKAATGWAPATPLSEGLAKTWHWIKAQQG